MDSRKQIIIIFSISLSLQQQAESLLHSAKRNFEPLRAKTKGGNYTYHRCNMSTGILSVTWTNPLPLSMNLKTIEKFTLGNRKSKCLCRLQLACDRRIITCNVAHVLQQRWENLITRKEKNLFTFPQNLPNHTTFRTIVYVPLNIYTNNYFHQLQLQMQIISLALFASPESGQPWGER
jgi:hypothetical protein